MITKRLWRWGIAWRFRLFQEKRHRRLVIEHVCGMPLMVLPDVFNPALFWTSAFLAEIVPEHLSPDAQVLDMGSGTGVAALAAAHITPHVTAVDINPEAVRCVQINALLNHMEGRLQAVQSDLFDALPPATFDVVLFNPPFFPGEPEDNYAHAWVGDDTFGRFLRALPEYLKQDGYALVVLSTNGTIEQTLDIAAECGLCMEVVAQRKLPAETMTVYKLMRSKSHDRVV